MAPLWAGLHLQYSFGRFMTVALLVIGSGHCVDRRPGGCRRIPLLRSATALLLFCTAACCSIINLNSHLMAMAMPSLSLGLV